MTNLTKLTRPVTIILAVVCLLIFLHWLGLLSPIENASLAVLSPIQRVLYGAGTSFNSFYQSLISFRQTAADNERLRLDVMRLTEENTQLRTLFADQQTLELQESFLTAVGYKYVPAQVIGKNPEPNFQTIIINRGSRDNIGVGMPVVVGSGIMVGTVVKVNARTAEVMMTNDSRSRIAAVIENEQGSQGVVAGEHGLSLKMELIPQGEIIKVGNTVVTSGLELMIPRGLVLGEISRLATEPTSLFQVAYLKPLVKSGAITLVSVISNTDGN